jgi:hypothetical protein
LLKRLQLPPQQKEHMPPEGKPQPAPDQISLLKWWIDAGAPATVKVAELKPPARIQRLLQARFGAPVEVVKKNPPRPINEVLQWVTGVGDDLSISLLSPNEPWLQCNASVLGTNFDDADLSRLAPIASNVRWLDLGGTRVTDAGIAKMPSMPNLTRLHLERTAITDSALKQIARLSELEYLNLYGTAVSDKGLEQLQSLPKLKQLYLWQTKVTPAAAKAFAESLTDEDQLTAWQNDIERLKARIRSAQLSIEIGAVGSETNATLAPVNAQCPVSGKPVDASKTVLHEGKRIAFCCDDCKAKFQQDPKPLLAKLNLNSAATEAKAEKK